MRCDRLVGQVLGIVVWFQSLLGFLMRCDHLDTYFTFLHTTQFQSLLGFLMRCDLPVYIEHHISSFQSLLGFLMRCDSLIHTLVLAFNHVSIPAGFSDALRHTALAI